MDINPHFRVGDAVEVRVGQRWLLGTVVEGKGRLVVVDVAEISKTLRIPWRDTEAIRPAPYAMPWRRKR